jgi:hypothetical protein
MSSSSSMVYPFSSSFSLNSDILEKYSWIDSPFYILVFLSCVLIFIFWFIFFPSYNLVRASNIYFGVFFEET